MRRRMVPVTRVLSSDSISSGYNTDQYLPVDSDIMDTGDYELWDRRQQQMIIRQRQTMEVRSWGNYWIIKLLILEKDRGRGTVL